MMTTTTSFKEQYKDYGKLVEDYHNLIYSLMHSTKAWSRYPQHREEMLQECYMTLYKCYLKFDESYGIKFSTFLYTSIRNTLSHYMRKLVKDDNTLYLNFEVVDERKDTIDHLYILECINKSDNRDILKMVLIDNFSQTYVADVLGMSQVNVSRIVSKFKSKMKEELLNE